MKFLRVSKRYAKAFLAIAMEHNLHERVYEDMQFVLKTFSESPELKVLMKSPIVRESKKVNILHAIFEKRIHDFTLKYLDIITRKKRAVLIQPIALQFTNVYCDFLGIERVEVVAATELDRELTEKVLKVAKRITTKKIIIEERVDKDLIGGFLLNIGGYQYDASIRKKINQLKKHLGY